MNSNYFKISDLRFPVEGSMYGFIENNTLQWCIEIISEIDVPFGIFLSAIPFKELSNSGFVLLNDEFKLNFKNSDSFALSTGSDMYFAKNFDGEFFRQKQLHSAEMHLNGRGFVDAYASPKYIKNLNCESSVDIKFSYFECSNSISIEDDIFKIQSLSGSSDKFNGIEIVNNNRRYTFKRDA